MEEESVEEKAEEDSKPRRSTRPSALKLYGITELSEAFGISLDSDSESDQEFAPTKEPQSDSSCGSTTSEEDGEADSNEGRSNSNIQDDPTKSLPEIDAGFIEDTLVKQEEAKPQNTICCVCLETSKENDIVACDMCRVTVHEGCYGVPEDDAIVDDDDSKSNQSSTSTVPWFCDSCKAGIESPFCELCPNKGGIFKQAINGCWVHVVCCLYISEIEYIEPKLLSGVTLDLIPPNRWGAKPCSLCEDEWNSITGVCISCDAGLCRTYFHVTCAQRAGLLCEVDESDSKNDENELNVPDAYFAHCSTHCDKYQAKIKRKHFKEIQPNQSKHEKSEIDDKLSYHLRDAKEDYNKLFCRMKKWYRPEDVKKQRQPRWLHNSPSAFRLLSEKAKLLGYSSKQAPQLFRNRSSIVSVGLNTEFITFFNERGGQIDQLENQIKELRPTVKQLQLSLKEKENLKSKKEADLKCLKLKSNQVVESTKVLFEKLNEVAGKNIVSLDSVSCNNGSHGSLITPIEDVVATVRCCACNGSHDNHLIIKCDTCNDSYHIHCLDPPLAKVPKKSANFGWQCEECCFDSEDELKPQEVNKDVPQSKFGRRIRKRDRYWDIF